MAPMRNISRAGGRFVRPATIAFLGAAVLAISGCGASKPVAISHTAIPTASAATGSFDVVEIAQAAHRLYVADRTHKGVDVFYISAAQPNYVMTIPMPSRPHGLALAPDLGQPVVGTAIG